ncbi:Eco57I restriction-modification methylase domain-containing protein [Pelistega ratti]|uniref:Eco57I restriction-modification methylase domain-containing protein n=1 Tax=Pelistega ratti TaxID=2652177 RepID=UPI00135BB4B6|nr:Eco57I restriction-modification methylase domain-containing protein [Pelistega ratti]
MEKLIEKFSTDYLLKYLQRRMPSLAKNLQDYSDLLDAFDKKFSLLEKLGEADLDDNSRLVIVTCQYEGQLSERSSKKQQFEITKKVLRYEMADAAIFVFYDCEGKFRFSYIMRNISSNSNNKYSDWKRYTYFVSKKETNRTFKDRIENCTFNSLDNIKEAFSVEKLTKDFYSQLYCWYEWIKSEEVGVTFPNDVRNNEDDRDNLDEKIIRLITRVLFVWFIRQKNLVPAHLFKKEELYRILKNFDPTSLKEGNYYNAILQNLFFATLNRTVNERCFASVEGSRDIKTKYRYKDKFIAEKEEDIIQLFSPVPFLNGGLFECLDKEKETHGIKYHLDGFSRNYEKDEKGRYKEIAFIPNIVFFDKERGLFSILERYNFTVEENEPSETQVALDPELLGNVFENLLGAYNKETTESARKQSGSFYTPKEIVHYMVDESIIAYLNKSDLSLSEEDVRGLVEGEDLPDILKTDATLRHKVYRKLEEIKIIDPACGSGAFPMGILKRMIHIMEKLKSDSNKSNSNLYDLKLHLIEKCIYGIDLQTIAIQITKLRFFISLIVEQDKLDISNQEQNYNIRPLPNLETKFVIADTLIGKQTKPQNLSLFEDPVIEELKDNLLTIRRNHFYAKTEKEKKSLRMQDEEKREQLSLLIQENSDFTSEDIKQFAQWNPYDQNASSPFFDAEWMFGIKDGFDIVIGNPPYIQLQKNKGILAKKYEKYGYKTFSKTGDIYSLFYEKGVSLLKEKGILCFITSNKWMRAEYGKKTRQFFIEYTNPLQLIDFAGQKVFESATVDTNILLLIRDKNRHNLKAVVMKYEVLNNLSDYFQQNALAIQFYNNENWVILNPIEQQIKAKVEKHGIPLKEWNISINYGIKTGFNEAFIIDGKTKDRLIAEDPKSAEIIRPILRGRDIKKYSYEFADKYLIATFPSKKYNIEKYPAIQKFLSGFRPKINQTGEKLCNKDKNKILDHAKQYNISVSDSMLSSARKKTHNQWFETQDSISYWEDFFKQKIVWNRIASKKIFSLVNENILIQDSMHFFTGEYLNYLIAILNSKLFQYFLYLSIGDAVGGNAGNSDNIKNLKIPFPNDSELKKFEEYLRKQQYQEIDNTLYKYYQLTTEEIQYIEINSEF